MTLSTNTKAICDFRAFLDTQGYDAETLQERLGRAQPPAEGESQQMFDDSREITTANVLIRVFLLGAPVDEATFDEFIPTEIREFCDDAKLVEKQDGMLNGRIVIIPVDDLLFASDAYRLLGTDRAAEFVLPASTHSANFLRFLTLRKPVGSSLDLGCGCGIHALFAAKHSESVIATDLSDAAIAYTRFNALLNNIDNVECRQGNLFEPVQGEKFDLIVSNPPFVISPSESFDYRDNPMELDSLGKALINEAPGMLNDGGHLQMLCEWAELAGQSWQERVGSWIRGCDAWILHAAPLAPETYVKQRMRDISGDGVPAESAESWMEYFHKHKVRSVHPGMLTMRRRDGNHWMHVQNLPGDVTAPAGEAVADGIAAVDFLEACADESLLQATLKLSDDMTAEQMTSDGKTTGIYLQLTNALRTDAEIDGAVAAFLNFFGGSKTVQQCIDEFGAATDAEIDKLRSDLLVIVRVFVSRGFLLPVVREA